MKLGIVFVSRLRVKFREERSHEHGVWHSICEPHELAYLSEVQT